MANRIGVDGGGTKTEFLVVDASGAVVARHLATGCNPNISGKDKARQIVLDGLAAAKGMVPGPIDMTLLCMAGHRPFWAEFAATLTGYGTVAASDDSLPVLELATSGQPGLVLHAGTGAFVAARGLDLSVHYAGGLGWRFGDEGSGYDLGKRAVARALLEIQGWARPSAIGTLVKAHAASAEPASILARYYNDPAPNAALAALAPEILALAGGNEPAAQAIVGESVSEIANLAARVSATLFPGLSKGAFPAGLSGPILNHPASVRVLSAHRSLAFTPVVGSPAEGLRRMLARGALT